MAYAVRVAENAEWLEVIPEEAVDSPRIDYTVVEEELKNRLRQGMKDILEEALRGEADEQIGALRYERGIVGRQDYRNGYRSRWLGTSLGAVALHVPRARDIRLSFTVFAAYKRRWQELDGLLLEAYIGGMSCRQTGERIAKRLGSACSGSTIAKLGRKLEGSLRAFRNVALKDEYEALILDGMYVRIKQCGEQKRPVVAVVGVKADGKVDLLAVRVCYSENSTEVEGILRDVKERGVRGATLKVVTLDGDKGLEAAVYAVYGNVRIQDCVFHRINRLGRNAQSKVRGRTMMKEASKVFSEKDVRQQRKAADEFCQRWRPKEPHAITCFESKLERCFEVHQLPPHLRSKASTSNLCEGLFRQIRDRTNQVGAFESPLSVELLFFAVVCQKTWINIPGRDSAAPLLSESPHLS